MSSRQAGHAGLSRRSATPTPGSTAQPVANGTAAHTEQYATAPGLPGRLARRLRAIWNAALGVIGTLVGLAPHVLHHIGLLAGTALIAGTGGTVVFGLVGFAASIPLLLRLRRRFGSWWAPAIGLAVFVAMFSLSAFVIGPAISGTSSDSPAGTVPSPAVDHSSHH